MAADASVRNKIIVGLADVQAGEEIGNVVRHTTGTTDSLTVGATNVSVGVSGGSVGFLGTTPAAVQQCTTNTVTALHACLAAVGLVNSTIGS